MTDTILTVNAGSSSLKFHLFDIAGGDGPARRLSGQMDGIGVHPRLRARLPDGTTLVDRAYDAAAVPDLPAAVQETHAWLRTLEGKNIAAVGHRVVHGGPDYAGPVRVDARVLQELARFEPLAPLHQANNLAPIRRVMEMAHDLPQVACFDTAFHRGHPLVADCYALPYRLHEAGLRRYGFHGLSYEYIARRLGEVAPALAEGRVIVAHLGSGASMCAMRNGRSIDSTMGFTALDGLPMGTRPGQLDPGIVLFLMAQKGMSPAAISDLLYRESGLKGLSGISNDMRDLLASPDPRAAFAIDHFVYRAALNAGMLASALGGLDGFVFTAGIGENSPQIRERVGERLAWLGVEIDAEANGAGKGRISSTGSRVAVHVIPTDEEAMIARHTLAVVRQPDKEGRP